MPANVTAIATAIMQNYPLAPGDEANLTRDRAVLLEAATEGAVLFDRWAGELADADDVEESWVLQGILDGAQNERFEDDGCEYLNYRLAGYRLARVNPKAAAGLLLGVLDDPRPGVGRYDGRIALGYVRDYVDEALEA